MLMRSGVLVLMLLVAQEFPERFLFLFDPAANPEADEVFQVIADGLDSGNPRLQSIALTAMASRPYLLMSEGFSEAGARGWLAERTLLQKLKPRVRALAEAPDRRVRREALRAFAALDFRGDGDEWALQLGDETIALCAMRYRLEEDAWVRAEAVRVIGFDDSADAGEPTIAAALHDPDAGVVAAAILGVEEHRMSAELPRLAALLAHPSAHVRTPAAGVVSTFGEAALPHLPDLERALAVEEDPVTADTMRESIAVLLGRSAA